MIIEYKDFKKIREENREKKIVFCSGSFDLLHAGHVLFFEDCKKFGDVLVVAIGDDEIIKIKGSDRPILNEHIRLKMLDSLRIVDYCFKHKNSKGPFLNFFMEEVFEQLRPDTWVINEDASEIPYRQELAKKYNIELHILERKCLPEFEEVSTSKIIKKIRSATSL